MVADFKKNGKSAAVRRIIFHIGGVVALCLVAVLFIANMRIYQKKQEFLAQVSDLKNQIATLKSQNSDLQQGINSSSDPAYIEKVAREELDLQKPGEKAVSFIMPSGQAQTATAPAQNPLQSWLGSIWAWLSGKK